MTDHANELRRYARKIAHPAGDVPSVMLAAADEIERLAARLEATEEDRARFLVEMGRLCAQCDALRLRIKAAEKERDALRAELMEQCRLLGMSAEREAKHLAQIDALERERSELKTARMAYASEFDGDVGSIHENIRKFKVEHDALRAELDALKAWKEEVEKQEPLAWRTFDGEGGYDYRGVDGNEDYRDEFIERNPGHANWVDALYTRPAPAQSVPERITHDQAPHVYSQEAAEGYVDGWNACVKKIVAAAPQNCIKAAMEAQREGCAEIVLQAAHKAADCNNLRDYELLRALSIEVAKAPEAKP